MVETRPVKNINGVIRHVPIEYNKRDGGAVTIAVSVRKLTAELLAIKVKELNITRSKLVDDILRKELTKGQRKAGK
jgi:hypothetical protein